MNDRHKMTETDLFVFGAESDRHESLSLQLVLRGANGSVQLRRVEKSGRECEIRIGDDMEWDLDWRFGERGTMEDSCGSDNICEAVMPNETWTVSRSRLKQVGRYG